MARQELINQRLLALFKHQLIGVVIASPKSGWLEVNDAWCRMTGYSREELLGREWTSLTHPEDLPAATAIFQRLLAGEIDQYILQKRYIRKDGSILPAEISVAAVRREDGSLDCVLGLAIDISERERAVAELQRSEEMFSAFMSHLPAAAFVKDADGQTLFVNRYLQELFGMENWEGKTTQLLIPGELGRQMEENDRQALAEGLLEVEEKMVDTQGNPRVFDTVKFAIPLSATTRLLGGLAFDITSRKRTEAELQRAEHELKQANVRLKLAVDSGRMGIWDWDMVNDKLNWDDRMLELYGLSRDQFRACYETYRNAVHPDDREREQTALQDALGGRKPYDLEFRVVHPSGTVRHIKADGLVLRDADNRPIRMIGLNQDITEHIEAEEERVKLEARFAQSQKMESVGRLAGGVAHDFNNLLTVINGHSQLVLEKLPSTDPLRNSLEQILKAGERAAALTQQLLAYSRKQVLRPRNLDLNGVIRNMQSMLERLVGEDVEVIFLPSPEDPVVCADPHQLEQVIMNLAVNARDAMPAGGSLVVETSLIEPDQCWAILIPEIRPGRYAMLAVSDTGVGMDEATQQRIFEPFFTTKEAGKGTGLGLSMVQGIVAQSGGYLGVYSKPGQGTSFKLYLPVPLQATVDEPQLGTSTTLRGEETILVVEDQAAVLEFTAAALEEYGYRVIQASGAAEALRTAENQNIDLVVTDVIMPRTSGPDLVAQLKRLRPGLKVIFMSGYADNVIGDLGVLEEGSYFIQKPFNPAELAEKIRTALAPAPHTALPVAPPAATARILITDDEPGVRSFLRAALQEAGYTVYEAAQGKDAVRQAHSVTVDLVITDLFMPEQEGIETIQRLRREQPHLGIIAISGIFSGEYLNTAKALGADAVLSKPIPAGLLLAKVAEVLARRKKP